jgi:regulator of sigma E protease
MNALFALIVFPLVFRAGVAFEAPVVGGVARGSGAWEAGIEPGDRVLEVGGKPIYAFANLEVEVALHGNRPVQLAVEDEHGERRVVTATPHFDSERGLYVLGLGPTFQDEPAVLTVDPDGPAAQAGIETGDLLLRIDGLPPARFPGPVGLDPIRVVVARDGVEREVAVVPRPSIDEIPPRIGVGPLARRVAGIRPGCGLVARLGLLRDDHVLAVGGRPFRSGDLTTLVQGPDETVWHVLRDDRREVLRATGATPAERQALADHVALTSNRTLQLHPSADGAAAAAGLLAGDWVQAVDDRAIDDWDDLRRAVEAAVDRPLRLRLLRPDPERIVDGLEGPTGTVVELTITPKREPRPDLGWAYQLAPLMNHIRAESFGHALPLGTVCSIDRVKRLYVTLKRLITGEVGANNLGGIVRISQVSYQAAQRGPSWFWYFLALLSVNLAFVNLLPIPVLDGGHLLFLLIEKVKGSPVSTRVLGYSQIVGLVFVLLLVLFVTYNDILRLL